MKRFAVAAACSLLVFSGAALADSACDHVQNNFDGMYCLNKIYQQADADLNQTYGKLAHKLDQTGKERLKDGQLAWIKTRDSQCSKLDGDDFYVNLACATSITIKRTQFLRNRYRECISSGCMNSKLLPTS